MLSRIADNMFWMNRYMERVDSMTRAMRYFFILGFDIWEGDNLAYKPLLQCFGTDEKAEDSKFGLSANTAGVMHHLAIDEKNPNSLKVLLGKARENARGSQDRITKEVWEQINLMYHHINDPDLEVKLKSETALDILDELEKNSLMYAGIVDNTMPRGQGWDFMNIGKYLDRALHTMDILDHYMTPINYDVDKRDEILYWRRLLYALSGYELYLKNNRGTHHTRQVMNQVIFNTHFPRSLMYSLDHGMNYLKDILSEHPEPAAVRLEKRFGRIRSNVEFTDQSSMTGDDLKQLVAETKRQLWEFSIEFSKLFFSYA